MARTTISDSSWTSLGTPGVDTLYGVEGRSIRLLSGSTAGITDPKNGVCFAVGEKFVVPAGVAVSAWAEGQGAEITSTAFGV